VGWPVCRWAWIQQGVSQIDLGDALGMASSGAMDSEQVIRVTLTIVTPVLTAGIGIVALVIGDWRERRTRHGLRKLAVEDAGRQVTFAEDWFTASKLIADSPDVQQRAAARAQAWLDEAAELLAETKPPPEAEEKRSVTARRLLLAYPMHRRGARILRGFYYFFLGLVVLQVGGALGSAFGREPVITGDESRPDRQVERSETVTLAFLVLLEALSPEERAVFLLKDVFEYEHSEIAEMLGTSPTNSRQLLRRAKRRLVERRPRLTGTAESRRAVAERFARAFASGDSDALTALLAKDVGFWSDGGGKATAARRPLVGREQVLNFLIGVRRVADTAGLLAQASLTVEEVNAEPAVVLRVRQQLESIFVVSVEGDTITGIRVVRNPDKLAHIDRRLTLH